MSQLLLIIQIFFQGGLFDVTDQLKGEGKQETAFR